jgi:fructose-1,6-bisphosphatase/inositol monophosphatase family enzyme
MEKVVHSNKKEILEIVNIIERYYDKLFLDTNISIDSYDIKNNQTSVTKFDIEITSFCIDTINQYLPNSNIIIEEDSSTSSDDFSGFTWIIDPLDGTASFIRGYPVWGIGISLLYKKEPILSYFYSPVTKEKFLAYDSKILLKDEMIKDSQMLLTDDTKTIFISSKLHEKISFDELRGYKLRNFGSTIYHLFLVATNRAESSLIASCYLWDIAAVFYLAELGNFSFYDYKTDEKINLDELLEYSSSKIDRVLKFQKS